MESGSETASEPWLSGEPYLRLHEAEEARLHRLHYGSESQESKRQMDGRSYIPLRFFKTVQGFHEVLSQSEYTGL